MPSGEDTAAEQLDFNPNKAKSQAIEHQRVGAWLSRLGPGYLFVPPAYYFGWQGVAVMYPRGQKTQRCPGGECLGPGAQPKFWATESGRKEQ